MIAYLLIWIYIPAISSIILGLIIDKMSNKHNKSYQYIVNLFLVSVCLLYSFIITDTFADMLYAIIFGLLLLITLHIPIKNLSPKRIILFSIYTFLTTVFFGYLKYFILVREHAALMIYFLPTIILLNPKKNIPMKNRAVTSIGVAIIIFSSLLFNNLENNPNPTKQSYAISKYIDEKYPENTYVVYSNDSFRNSISVVPAYFKDSSTRLTFKYMNNEIIEIIGE